MSGAKAHGGTVRVFMPRLITCYEGESFYEFNPVGAENLAEELKEAARNARDNAKAERRLLSMEQLDKVEGMLRGGRS